MTLTTDTTTDLKLTSDNVKALRNADAVVLRLMDGVTTVEAFKRIDGDDGFGDRERKVIIICPDAAIRVFETDTTSGRTEATGAFAHISSARFHHEWVTVAQLVKTGDVLRPFWVANNNSEVVKDAGLTVDMYGVEIIRGEPGPKQKRLTFLLGTDITRPGSPARGIRFIS